MAYSDQISGGRSWISASLMQHFQMLRPHLESDVSFPTLNYINYWGNCPFFGCGQIRRGSHLTFHRCLSALSLIVWFMGDVPSYVRVSVPKTSFLLLSIKVQVVTMVWHSLSACGFRGPCTGAAGERWLSHSASCGGERWEGRR